MGAGNSWDWELVGSMTAGFVGGVAEVEIPRALLGNPAAINFHWFGDNGAVNGSALDYYPDAANDTAAPAASRRFRYTM